MKKFLVLLIVCAMLATVLTSCDLSGIIGGEGGQTEYTLEDLIKDAGYYDPAKVTTLVEYNRGGDTLRGTYVTVVSGDVTTFNYEYERYATVEEEAESRIVTSTGVITYKDGLVSTQVGDEKPSEWAVVTPSGINTTKLDLNAAIDVAVMNEAKTTATFTLEGDLIEKVLGTALDAEGAVVLDVTVSNSYLSGVKLVYKTTAGADVIVNTSYTYAADGSQELTVDEALAYVAALYRVSVPTKSVVKTTQKVGLIVLNGEAVLKVGTIGGKVAATYEKHIEELGDVLSATAVKKTDTLYEYLEDYGARKDGGAWVAENADFRPVAGFLGMNLSKAVVNDAHYENNTFTFVVKAADVANVFGYQLTDATGKKEINADITVSISNAGGVITAVTLAYTVEPDADAVNQNEMVVKIVAEYSYDLEQITIKA